MRFLKDEGCTLHEIASRSEISPNWAWRLARRHGIPLDNARGRRRLACILTPEKLTDLDILAGDAGVSRSEMASRIMSVVLEDRAKLRRMLGKLALRKQVRADRRSAP